MIMELPFDIVCSDNNVTNGSPDTNIPIYQYTNIPIYQLLYSRICLTMCMYVIIVCCVIGDRDCPEGGVPEDTPGGHCTTTYQVSGASVYMCVCVCAYTLLESLARSCFKILPNIEPCKNLAYKIFKGHNLAC